MLPLSDNIPSRRRPITNYAIMVACAAVFLYEMSRGGGLKDFVAAHDMTPARLTGRAAAAAVHVVMYPASTVPVVGASGAIAAVMGAYLLLYPQAMIVTLVPIFILPYIVLLPAVVFLVIWFIIQLFGGFSAGSQMATGVAWWAHVGGFVAGLAAVYVLGWAGLLKRPLARVARTTTPFHPYGYWYRRW
jgi:membrane associated rhomboid family serine protease